MPWNKDREILREALGLEMIEMGKIVKPPKRRKRCTYCSKLIAVEHVRVMGLEVGCRLNWRCMCNWQYSLDMHPNDQIIFDIYKRKIGYSEKTGKAVHIKTYEKLCPELTKGFTGFLRMIQGAHEAHTDIVIKEMYV